MKGWPFWPEANVSEMKFGPLEVPRRVIHGPGPSAVHPRVLRAMSTQVISYRDKAFDRIMGEVSEMLRLVYRTREHTFAVGGAGSAGMESGLVSFLEPGDTVVICSYGQFCERMILMAERLGANVVPVRSEWGRPMDPQQLAGALAELPDVKMVTAIHAETSTGVLQPLEPLAELAHEHDALFMADMVTSLAGSEVEFDRWGIDYAYSGSQKCLAGPPGLSPAALREDALQKIRDRDSLPSSWFLDLSLTADFWGPEHKPHYTTAVSLVFALREALALALEEGLETRWERHRRVASALRAGVEAIGLRMIVPPESRLDQITLVEVPEGVDDAKFRNQLIDDYSIELGGGLGQFRGKVWRIGLMGDGCTPANVLGLLNAFERLLPEYGVKVPVGDGPAAAGAELAKNPPTPY